MMGFAATSMSEFFQDTVDMSPPTIKVVKLSEEMEKISEIDGNQTIVKVSFDLKIDNLVNSKLVQIVSVEHAKQMINKLMQLSGGVEEQDEPAEVVETEIVEEQVEKEHLTQEEKDVLGEIANISIGSASTVLSTLLNQPVSISTPNVEAINVRHYDGVPVPFVILNVDFVEGLKNENVFVFTKDVALTMVDLMMMGTGEVDSEKELSELELSGIKEIMNQMMGHAATAMSEMFQEKMDMTPPNVKFVTLKEEMEYLGESMKVDELVQITFNLEIGDLLQSKMYQILPISEAKEMVRRLLYPMMEEEEEIVTEEIEEEKVVEPVVQPIEFKEVKQMEPVYMDTSILQNVEMNVKFVFGSTVKTIQDFSYFVNTIYSYNCSVKHKYIYYITIAYHLNIYIYLKSLIFTALAIFSNFILKLDHLLFAFQKRLLDQYVCTHEREGRCFISPSRFTRSCFIFTSLTRSSLIPSSSCRSCSPLLRSISPCCSSFFTCSLSFLLSLPSSPIMSFIRP
ncbi:Flagellar motor switch protein FliN [Bacillus cereus]|nr:Flagellar motor switch protein FliN [Bacillus cereus]